MGGIHVNTHGQIMLDARGGAAGGMWAVGECGCVSVHGSNRLGSNSLSQCSVWGRIAGNAIPEYIQKNPSSAGKDILKQAEAEEARINGLLENRGTVNPYELQSRLQKTMDDLVYVYRKTSELTAARDAIRELRGQYGDIYITDKGREFNSNLRDTLEIENLIDLAEVVVEGAIRRKESRGAHAMVEFPKRDDTNYLKHTIASRKDGGLGIDYIPVTLTRWEPEERVY